MLAAQLDNPHMLPRQPEPALIANSRYASPFDTEMQNTDSRTPQAPLHTMSSVCKSSFAAWAHVLKFIGKEGLQDNYENAKDIIRDGWSHTSTPFGIKLEPPCETVANLFNRAGQCCFLCLEGRKSGQFTVQVPCLRPTKPRRIISQWLSQKASKTGITSPVKALGGVTYEKLNPREKAYESDATIYQRLKESCFHYQGKWKRWLPFYGIIDVQEVNVRNKSNVRE